jgi:glutamate-1-semialdehyde 2,1-aminomutase
MEVVNEHRLPGPEYVWSASTTGGNPISCAAAMAALDIYSDVGCYDHLQTLGDRFRELLGSVLAATGTPGQVLGLGPLAQVAFASHPVVDQRSWLASDRARGRRVMLELVRRGIYLNPMGTKLYLSLAHSDEFFSRFAEVLEGSLVATRARG